MKNFKSKGISLENMVGEGLPVKEKARKAYNQTIALPEDLLFEWTFFQSMLSPS